MASWVSSGKRLGIVTIPIQQEQTQNLKSQILLSKKLLFNCQDAFQPELLPQDENAIFDQPWKKASIGVLSVYIDHLLISSPWMKALATTQAISIFQSTNPMTH